MLTRPLRILLLLGAVGLPVTLLWDYAWESTLGIDTLLSPPHLANDLAVVLLTGLGVEYVRRDRARAPLGAWPLLWGGLAFATAFIFDRWWQLAYGLGAGIWHPPQILKAVAYAALGLGAWCLRPSSAAAAGSVLALMMTLTLAVSLPNRQHGATFHLLACALYPAVLICAHHARPAWGATRAALAGMLIIAGCVWLLPLFPAEPLTGPIFNPRTSLLPPPFPLLLVLPAMALDLLLRNPGRNPAELGLGFALVFIPAQWIASAFLLSPSADSWVFAGGGKHWPFYLQIAESAKTSFWTEDDAPLNMWRAAAAMALAAVSAWIGSRVVRHPPAP